MPLLTFNQATAQGYKDQLQLYQDKIGAGTITQAELNQAKETAIQYYTYLDQAGIEYGGIANEVIQGSTFYGQYANGMLSDALHERLPFAPDSQIQFHRDQVAISLALEDSTLRSQTTSGALSSRQIADYHYAVFGANSLPREAWG